MNLTSFTLEFFTCSLTVVDGVEFGLTRAPRHRYTSLAGVGFHRFKGSLAGHRAISQVLAPTAA